MSNRSRDPFDEVNVSFRQAEIAETCVAKFDRWIAQVNGNPYTAAVVRVRVISEFFFAGFDSVKPVIFKPFWETRHVSHGEVAVSR
jgi:hypothetical protein